MRLIARSSIDGNNGLGLRVDSNGVRWKVFFNPTTGGLWAIGSQEPALDEPFPFGYAVEPD